ncbi:MAG TPA: hypothetical protein DCS93_08385, partial [Microscillaceae bacterium]|nr:hypothetical protein [Microscillaceae bacterium]
MLKTLINYILLLLIFFAGSWSHSYAQTSAQKTIDSLEYLLKSAENTKRIKVLVELSSALGSHAKALEYAQQALTLAKKINDLPTLAMAYNNLGNAYIAQEKHDLSINAYQQAVVLWEKLGTIHEGAKSYYLLGVAQTDKSDLTGALKSFINARRFFEKSKDEIALANTFRKTGIIYSILKEYRKGLDYYYQALQLYQNNKHEQGLCSTYNNIGVIHSQMNEHVKAWGFYERSRKIALKINDPFMVATTTGNMGEVLSAQKKFKEALPYYRKELLLFRELNIKKRQIEPLEYMAQAYLELGKGDSAVYFGKKAYEIGRLIKDNYRIIEATEILSNVYQQQQNDSLALYFYKVYTQYKDSLFNRNKSLELAEVEKKYQTEKEQNAAKEREKLRNFIIALVALLIIAVFAIVQWVFVSRQQKQKKQASENVELLSQIGKEITSSLNLEEISDKAYQYLNQLMDASIFGIGINIPEADIVEFKLALSHGKKIKPYKRSLHYKDQLAVWCLEHKKSVFINDLEKDYQKYISRYDAQLENTLSKFEDGSANHERPQSAIYLPLVSGNDSLGVICVQSKKKNAYTDYHLNILENLAVYAAIALKNARAYEERRQKNLQIEKHVNKFRQANKLIQEHYRELNRQKEYLEKTNIKLKQSQDSKARLTAMIAHDLKNPLNVIFAYSSDSEVQKVENPQVRKQIKDIHRSARRIKAYTNDMLEVQKYATSNLTLSKAQHNFHKIAQEAINYLQPFVEEKSIQVHNQISKELYGKFDAVYLERVFENLLTNAIKYTPIGGSISIISEENDDTVNIKVADTGQGIDPNDFENIFEAFNQAGNARDFANTGSTGLGLTFCKIAMEAHGSQIKVSSKLGQGTTFYFSLPRVIIDNPQLKSGLQQKNLEANGGEALSAEEKLAIQSLVQQVAEVPFYKRKKLEELVRQFEIDPQQINVQKWRDEVLEALKKRNKIRYQEL